MTYREHLEDLQNQGRETLQRYQQDETLDEGLRRSLLSDTRRRLRTYEQDLSRLG